MATNTMKSDNSGNHFTPKVLSKNTRTYVDSEGYTTIEQKTPTSHLVLRYNEEKNDMMYSYNSHTKYKGPISTLDSTERIDFDIMFDELFSDVDASLDKLDRQLDLFDDWLDAQFPFGDTAPRLSSSSSSEYYQKKRYTKRKSSGCFGCLLWTILGFIFLCLILYGMGVLGGAIIDFLKGLF